MLKLLLGHWHNKKKPLLVPENDVFPQGYEGELVNRVNPLYEATDSDEPTSILSVKDDQQQGKTLQDQVKKNSEANRDEENNSLLALNSAGPSEQIDNKTDHAEATESVPDSLDVPTHVLEGDHTEVKEIASDSLDVPENSVETNHTEVKQIASDSLDVLTNNVEVNHTEVKEIASSSLNDIADSADKDEHLISSDDNQMREVKTELNTGDFSLDEKQDSFEIKLESAGTNESENQKIIEPLNETIATQGSVNTGENHNDQLEGETPKQGEKSSKQELHSNEIENKPTEDSQEMVQSRATSPNRDSASFSSSASSGTSETKALTESSAPEGILKRSLKVKARAIEELIKKFQASSEIKRYKIPQRSESSQQKSESKPAKKLTNVKPSDTVKKTESSSSAAVLPPVLTFPPPPPSTPSKQTPPPPAENPFRLKPTVAPSTSNPVPPAPVPPSTTSAPVRSTENPPASVATLSTSPPKKTETFFLHKTGTEPETKVKITKNVPIVKSVHYAKNEKVGKKSITSEKQSVTSTTVGLLPNGKNKSDVTTTASTSDETNSKLIKEPEPSTSKAHAPKNTVRKSDISVAKSSVKTGEVKVSSAKVNEGVTRSDESPKTKNKPERMIESKKSSFANAGEESANSEAMLVKSHSEDSGITRGDQVSSDCQTSDVRTENPNAKKKKKNSVNTISEDKEKIEGSNTSPKSKSSHTKERKRFSKQSHSKMCKHCKHAKHYHDQHTGLTKGKCDDYYDKVIHDGLPLYRYPRRPESWASDMSWNEYVEREYISRLKKDAYSSSHHRHGSVRSNFKQVDKGQRVYRDPHPQEEYPEEFFSGQRKGSHHHNHRRQRSLSDDNSSIQFIYYRPPSICSCADCWEATRQFSGSQLGRSSVRSRGQWECNFCTCGIRPDLLSQRRKVKFAENAHKNLSKHQKQTVDEDEPKEGSYAEGSLERHSDRSLPSDVSGLPGDEEDNKSSTGKEKSTQPEKEINDKKSNLSTDERYRPYPWELEEWDRLMRHRLLKKRRRRALYMGAMALAMVVFVGLIVAVVMVYLRRKQL